MRNNPNGPPKEAETDKNIDKQEGKKVISDAKVMKKQEEDNKKTLQDKNKENDKKSFFNSEMRAAIVGAIVGVVVGAFLTIITEYLVGYVFPGLFNKPNVTMSAQNISSVKPGILSKTIAISSQRSGIYNAKLIDGHSDKIFGYIRGDANVPGYADITLQLSNHGEAQALIDRFDINVVEYRSLDNQDYVLYKSGEIDSPDEFVILYSTIDPIIGHSIVLPAKVMEGGRIFVNNNKILNLRLSPGEHGTYYLRLSFSQYGIYTLEATVHYGCT